ncbi:nucleotide-binding protein [Desulfothermobacter acidiphilus]|uniref:ATP-binding protein n=1 Tax=Desulfothermobacter acidiphilus TaxID=1938353 RepID=UPI003F8B0E73
MRGVKLAISGKGGAGKTTLAAALIRAYAATHRRVYAVDADPDASLALALGLTEEEADRIVPVVKLGEKIKAVMGGEGGFFTLNPPVAEVLEEFCFCVGNIFFMRLGEVKKGGTSCYCRENAFMHALINALLLERDEVVVMDTPAGIEHFSRGTAQGVDILLIVTEPNRRSLHTALLVERLAEDLGIRRVAVVGNKVRTPQEEESIRRSFPGKVLALLPYDELLWSGDGAGGSSFQERVREIKATLMEGRLQ